MKTYSEQSKWRKFLSPVVTGLVALMSAVSIYLSAGSKTATNETATGLETRMALVEQRADGLEKRTDGIQVRLGNIENSLGALNVSVAEIATTLKLMVHK